MISQESNRKLEWFRSRFLLSRRTDVGASGAASVAARVSSRSMVLVCKSRADLVGIVEC